MAVDIDFALIADQTFFLAVDQQKLIDPVFPAQVEKSSGHLFVGHVRIFQNQHPVIAAVRAEQSQKDFGVLFGHKVDDCHCPVGQVQAADVADIFQDNQQRPAFGGDRCTGGRISFSGGVHRFLQDLG